jgi:uncharacterized protein (TIGR02284 family)
LQREKGKEKTMSAEKLDDTLDVIEKLIETCRDGQAGYLEAAEHSRNHELRAFFSQQALERAKFAGELETEARHLVEADPGRKPSMASTLHRAWIDLKHKLGAGDPSILESVEAGESVAREHYRDALKAGLPRAVQEIVERQAESVFAAHEQVRTLQGVYKRAA